MLNFTAAQLDAFLVAWAYPIARVLGMIGTGPIFGSASTPRRIRLALGLIVGAAIVPTLPPSPAIQPGTWYGIAIFVEQILIGIGLGISLRLVMTAVDIAGDIIGLQMGLSFATFFDPNSSGRTAVLAEIFSLLSTLTFFAMNGHLLLISALVRSFELVPIAGIAMEGHAWLVLMRIGSIVFATGLLISLPIMAALLITNIALAILTRAAPQLNIFAIGFPITATVGLVTIMFSLPALSPVLIRLFDQGFELLGLFLKTLTPG